MQHFVITVKDDNYRFILKAKNGMVILYSHPYFSDAACRNGIESVRTNGIYDERYQRLERSEGMHCFVLKASNGAVIGSSQEYFTKAAMENGIESVKENCQDISEPEYIYF